MRDLRIVKMRLVQVCNIRTMRIFCLLENLQNVFEASPICLYLNIKFFLLTKK